MRFARPLIPVGAEAVSEPVLLPVDPLDQLTVTMYFSRPTGPATFHDIAAATSYRAEGDHRFDHRGTAFTSTTTSSWYYLSGVDVLSGSRGAVVTFGDSVTDGTGSTPDADRRYPDALADRLVAAGLPLSVLNAGISGNRVLNDSACFGEKAVARFQRDVLDRPGIRTVIVMEGINDIGFHGAAEPCFLPNDTPVTAEQLVEGHRTLIRAAHSRGIRIIGGTLMPFEGSFFYNTDREAVRDEVNEWIRTSGEYNGVVDFERALTAPGKPDRLRREFNEHAGQEGDWLHPNDAGLAAMAAAVNLADL
ncbi:SGNH/GDSL hydrolase family protein [Nonomuraea mesophila]|uniref:SGNH/GDSL hydrolase family protein n=1 Tax=Nonomuraea mesophila TaxID=2530382 RepID=UPI001C70A239|nr:SGNH/GDSL hydrolase family protein [Nonomuraea mesophila]